MAYILEGAVHPSRSGSTSSSSLFANMLTAHILTMLKFLARKLLTVLPTSMAEERTMSAITKAQAGRPGLKISSLVLGKILSPGVSGWLTVNIPLKLSFLDARASSREVIVGMYEETTKSETLFVV